MADEISVYVTRPNKRKFWLAQWIDPVTGDRKSRTTKKTKKSDAQRVAAVIQNELMEGRYQSPWSITWEQFRDRYEADAFPGMAVKTQRMIDTVMNSIEEHIKPSKLVSLDAEQIRRYVSKLRGTGVKETSIKSYLSHLKAALRWAYGQKLLHEVPKINMPSRTNKATKRAVTGEEFERMLEAVPKVVGEAQASEWAFFLRGLWWSGLRLGEALALSWNDPSTLCLMLDGRRPLLSIPPDGQKNGKATLWPIPPEFYDHLMTVPAAKRKDRVFPLWSNKYKTPRQTTYYTVGKIIAEIGKSAGVKTSGEAFATAHDLRRSFGVRWSKRVMPAILQKLMRHASIQTTMAYYAVEDAASTADAVWDAFTGPQVAPEPQLAAEVPDSIAPEQ